jgi:methionine synthase II (cobalamin-independent)
MIIGMERAGVDHEALLDTYIRAINVITEGRPDDLMISVHMCRGNYKVGIFHFKKALRFTWLACRVGFITQKEDTDE